jgi:predicted O-linked N-acetylglucosamine transferase (SPINDLY family)
MFKKALEYFNSGQFSLSKNILGQILKKQPLNLDALEMLGVILAIEKNLEEAVDIFTKAINIVPSNSQLLYNRGNALIESGRYEEAIVDLEKTVAINNNNLEALLLLGISYKALNLNEKALSILENALSIEPRYVKGLINKGCLLFEMEQYEHAVDVFNSAIVIDPASAEAHYNKGECFREQKLIQDAIVSYSKSIEIQPKNAIVYNHLGAMFFELENYELAIENYEFAIELNPNYAEAYANLGNALLKINFFDAAMYHYDKAIGICPNIAELHYLRGDALLQKKIMKLAIESFKNATALKSDYIEALIKIGHALNELNIFEEALKYYEKALEIDCNSHYLLGSHLLLKQKICDWKDLNKGILQIKNKLVTENKVAFPLDSHFLFDDPKLHYLASKTLAKEYQVKNKCESIMNSNRVGKIRIGYFSSDLRYHPVTIWLVEQIENHDKSKFELFAFSFLSIVDPMRNRLHDAFDYWFDVEGLSDIELIRLARAQNLDIAIDLNGYTKDGRTECFSARIAPIQINHIGFPGTMGADYIDYIIADKHSINEDNKNYFTEKVYYIPCGYTYDNKREVSNNALNRTDFGLPDDAFVFTCQNGSQKISPEVFNIWMEILRVVPNSVIWLLDSNDIATLNLKNAALSQGIDSSRLIFTKREKVDPNYEIERVSKYLSSYGLANLFLDTWPYNAGTTAIDALWAGLPILTKSGMATTSRMANSALHAIDLKELITHTEQEYKDLAIKLATDNDILKQITQKLNNNRLSTPLFDTKTNIRSIEKAYIDIVENHFKNIGTPTLF